MQHVTRPSPPVRSFRPLTSDEPDQSSRAGSSADAASLLEHQVVLLRQALQRRDQFTAMVAHELRGPLTSIKGASRTLLRNQGRLKPAVVAQLLQDVDAEVDRMAGLLSSLLELSRDETGADAGGPRPTVLRPLLSRLLAEVRGRTADRSVALRTKRDLPPALVDPLRFEQIVRNLLDNAVKYSPPGARIAVIASSGPDWIEISVRNEGLPLEPEVLERLFDPFYRGPLAVEECAGSGLGLTICRRLLEAQGGEIWAESGPAHVTLRFTLPQATEDVR